jgi:hypothetical protein
MKNLNFLIVLFILGLTNSYAQNKNDSLYASSSKIYIFQGRNYGIFSIRYRVYANGKMLCKLPRNSHCEVSVPAGITTLTTDLPFPSLGKQRMLTLNLEAGKTYYLQGDTKFELLPPSSPMILTEIVPNNSKLEEIRRSKEVLNLLSSSE